MHDPGTSMTRRPLCVLVTAMALAGCSGEAVGRPPPPPVDWLSFAHAAPDAGPNLASAKEGAVVERYATALGSAGFAGLGRLFDDDAHFAFPGRSDTRGRDAVVREHEALFGAFEQRRLVPSRVWRTPSTQMAEWTMSGVHAREWLGIPPTQRPVTIKGMALLWTRDDGSIVDCHLYFDVAAVKALLGAGPKELSGLAAPPMPSGPPEYVDRTGQEPENVAVVRTALDALESNEVAYLDALTDDVEIHTLERADPLRGKVQARAQFRALHKAIAQLDTTMRDGWTVAQFGIVEYTIDGEQRGPLGWIPPQRDQVVRLHVVDVNEIKEGKIARIWRYDNPAEIMAPGP